MTRYNPQTDKFEEASCKNVKCGDIISISEDSVVPADVVLLDTVNDKGQCFVETKNLDGETNLKTKLVPREIMDLVSEKETELSTAFNKIDATITCQIPDSIPTNFAGRIKCNDLNEEIPLNINNVLLRGCILRNTMHVQGVVVYAGHETKVMMNSSKPFYKTSALDVMTNISIIVIFIL